MRKTILSFATAIALVISGSALAARDGVIGGSSSGASVSSGAFAASSGNGSAFTRTGGYQSTTAGVRLSSDSSYRARNGSVSVEGVASAEGATYSETYTRGSGVAGSGTTGSSYAVAGAAGYFDTHRDNPEGWAVGAAKAKNANSAGTISAGYGGGFAANESGTRASFVATASGDRDGGYRGRPTTDTVETSALATSESYDYGVSVDYGYAAAGESSRTSGWSFAKAHAEVGNVHSDD